MSGCSSNYLALSYNQPVSVHSNLSAKISVKTGIVEGNPYSSSMAAGGFYVPIQHKIDKSRFFRSEEQHVFINGLKAELLRHKIISSVDNTNNEHSVSILIDFIHTKYFPNSIEYKLIVVMSLESGNESFRKTYHIGSYDGDSVWTRGFTNEKESKSRASYKLLAAVVPDIELFVEKITAS